SGGNLRPRRGDEMLLNFRARSANLTTLSLRMKTVRLPLLLVAAAAPVLMAQPNRLLAPIDPNRTMVLKGSATMPAEPHLDAGLADPALRMTGITVMMNQTAAQHAELEQLLEEQRDPDSSNYQNWLTPEQFADRFGLSRADMDKVVAWLESSG